MGSCGRAQLAVWGLATSLLGAAHASAQPAAVELTWQAPAGCPTEAAVRAEARRALGAVPRDAPALTAHARVTRQGTRYALQLETTFQGERGERTLEASDCRALAQSVTLVLGVLLGIEPEAAPPDATAAESDAQPATTTATEEPATPASEPAREPASPADGAPPVIAGEAVTDDPERPTFEDGFPDTDDHTSPSVVIFATATTPLGLLPEPALGASVGAELVLGRLALGLGVHGWAARSQHPEEGLRTRMDGVGASLFACHRFELARLGAGLCAGGQLAAVRCRSDGPGSEPGSAVAPWNAIFTAAQLVWPRDAPLGVRLWADAAVSTQRPRFVVRGLDVTHHRVPSLVGQLGLGMVWTP